MAKILIADDSETLRTQLKNDLQENNHEVIEAENGLEAINHLKEHHDIQVCILDINMPEATGIDVLKTMRGENLNPKALVFMLTTDSSAELKAVAKELNVKAWITKPYQKAALMGALERLLQ
jgi:CheY-like chemotaxis protein